MNRRKKNVEGKRNDDAFFSSLLGILRGGLELQRFPTFCAALVGGSTFLQARDIPPYDLGKLANRYGS